jgi:alpha-D-ribose 1-methylphosphonate 5-triphosphate synthase subunit PhnL
VRRLGDLKAAGVAMIGVFHYPGDVAELIDREISLVTRAVSHETSDERGQYVAV